MIAAVIARLEDRLPSLRGRIAGAASLARLLADNQIPTATPALHVVPSDIAGGAAEDLSGLFRQDVTRELTVILTIRSDETQGRLALEGLEALLDEIFAALCGWAPEADTDAFLLGRARLDRFQGGTFVYSITFKRQDHLRITA